MEEETICMAILILVSCLICAVFIHNFLHHYGIHCFHETSILTLVGIIIAFILVKFGKKSMLDQMESDFTNIFFIVLLPPIIFSAAYSAEKKVIVENFGSILTFAFLGTFISALIIAFLLFLIGKLGVIHQFTFIEAMAYGSLISATDPVSVISILKDKKADRTLYNIIFGESIFNDAVGIVMYQTVILIKDSNCLSTLEIGFSAIGLFTLIFLGSFSLGIVSGLITSYIIKLLSSKNKIKNNKVDELDVTIVLGSAFCIYLFTQGLQLSGIVAILFHGIILAQYTSINLNITTRKNVQFLINSISYLFESCVFLFLGMSSILFVFTTSFFQKQWNLIILNVVIILFSRLCNVAVNAVIVNKSRLIRPINLKHCFLIWYSGLRGSIAYILALKCVIDFGNNSSEIILFLTVGFALITILIQGTFFECILNWLNVKDNPEDYSNIPRANDKGEIIKEKGYFEDIKKTIAIVDEKSLMPFFKAYDIESNQPIVSKINLNLGINNEVV